MRPQGEFPAQGRVPWATKPRIMHIVCDGGSKGIHRNITMAQNRYESTFIVKGSLDDKDIDPIIAKAESFIQKNGGTVIDMERWGRRKLAYQIGHETQGAYVSAHFTSSGDLITKLERMYSLDENIIRFLTLTMPESSIKGRVAMKKREVELAGKREAAALASGAQTPKELVID
jgi:small subunit ribosomal protein S6